VRGTIDEHALGTRSLPFFITPLRNSPAIAPVLIATAGYYGVSVVVKRTNREIKREANSCMGPLQSNLQEAMRARALADAMGCQEFFIDRHHEFANKFNRANFAAYCLLSWMQMVGVYFSFFISVSIGLYGELKLDLPPPAPLRPPPRPSARLLAPACDP
jgi:hypothetical protein